MSKDNPDMVSMYTPAERRVLAQWLMLPPIVRETLPSPLEALAELGVKDTWGYLPEAAAVAAMLLESVRDELPSFSMFVETGEDEEIEDDGEVAAGWRAVTFGRDRPVRKRPVPFKPEHVITINWASSGPGIDWPAAYYVTYLPVYDRFVLTVSFDTYERYGAFDFAVYDFCPDHSLEDMGLKAGCLRGLATDWKSASEHEWELVTFSGVVSEAEARQLARQVWAGR